VALHYHDGLEEGGHAHPRMQPERRQQFTNRNAIADMRDAPYIKVRLLIVLTAAAFACAALTLVGGCKSTQTQAATAPGTLTTGDAELAARVKQALTADPDLKSLPVSVATYRGAVQLSGYVDSEAQIQKALAVTRGVSGAQSVSNDLQIRPR
jgi:hyperosmotically inducible periplasmic protein